MSFYFKKLTFTGVAVEPSEIEFKPGINIVYAPSDTGKSYILNYIDYIFGSESIDADTSNGYDTVTAEVIFNEKPIYFKRMIGQNKINVNTSIEGINNGDLSLREAGDIFLYMIGIKDSHKIISNTNFAKQQLTWRTIQHLFLIDEGRIIQKPSILLPTQNTAQTPALSALLFLFTGLDFSETEEKESAKVRTAKKEALKNYISEKLRTLKENYNPYFDNNANESSDIVLAKIDATVAEISSVENLLSSAIAKDKQLNDIIQNLNKKIAQNEVLQDRYRALESQYNADIGRLSFIVDGQLASDRMTQIHRCPFCDSTLLVQPKTDYAEAASNELNKIKKNLEGLSEAQSSLKTECIALKEKLNKCASQRANTKQDINAVLVPKIKQLKKELNFYRQSIEIEQKIRHYNETLEILRNDLAQISRENEDNLQFKVKEHFTAEIIQNINQILQKLLQCSKFRDFGGSRFDTGSFDITIDGKPKSAFGKGYRAYFNTILALTIREYLGTFGSYTPAFLSIDSPILSLQEKDDEPVDSSLRTNLFKTIVDNPKHGQVIIIENEIPDGVDYSSANVIHFTKDEQNGRYGLYKGVRS